MAHSLRRFVSWRREASSCFVMRSRPGTIQRSVTATRWAKKHGVRPQLVVCSSAVRAQQTLQRLLPGLGEPEVWVEVTLYAAGPRRCSSGTTPA
jgi:phosphohistidine phosphatase SixA